MKTLEALYKEVLASDTLKQEFTEAVKDQKLAGFLKSHGCDAAPEEAVNFLKDQAAKEGAVSDSELAAVSGGCNGQEAIMSVASVGILCAAGAVISHEKGQMTGKDGEILCGIHR